MITAVITTHQSHIRPTGHAEALKCIETLLNVLPDVNIIVVNNGSDSLFWYPQGIQIVERKDQIDGLTGAWNEGVNLAYKNGAELIIQMSDDISFNDTFKQFGEIVMNHPDKDIGVFGTLTDSMTSYPPQRSRVAKSGVREITGSKYAVHGWMFAFTKNFYEQFLLPNGNLFDTKYPFGYNEEHFQRRIWKDGGKSFIVDDCLVHHEHLNAWKKVDQL
jgi:glycosyltransferase involved in cell wall biosynthesis